MFHCRCAPWAQNQRHKLAGTGRSCIDNFQQRRDIRCSIFLQLRLCESTHFIVINQRRRVAVNGSWCNSFDLIKEMCDSCLPICCGQDIRWVNTSTFIARLTSKSCQSLALNLAKFANPSLEDGFILVWSVWWIWVLGD